MTATFMKINEQLLKFPKTLPNDIEMFMVFYPAKFPGIVSYYEEVAKKIAGDPKAYQEYGQWTHDELFKGFEKIKSDYENGDKDDLSFLVSIDQRFNKLTCYRFWVVNYLFPDGPLHEYFVDTLKNLIRKFVDVGEEVEEFERKIVQIQRDFLQSDYADLYLRQALSGVKLVKLLESNPKTKTFFYESAKLIDQHSSENISKINSIWDQLVNLLNKDATEAILDVKKELEIPLEQAKWRKSMLPVYNMLTHAVEFREENKILSERHNGMKQKIDDFFSQAKQKLSVEEYELFEVAYQQSRNFAMFKDVMGEVDPYLLPLWFGILYKAQEILSKTTAIELRHVGHAGMFYHLAWYLPPDLKAKVMTPDLTPFDLKTL